MKMTRHWFSSALQREMGMARWGHYGVPVLLFPTAGGDPEEVERMHLIGALWPLIEGGRIKVYSCDSVAGRAWMERSGSPEYLSALQNQFDRYVGSELAPAILEDCGGADVPIFTAGASIGAFNAVATVCRHPDVFKLAIGMSGTYDLSSWLNGEMHQDFYFSSPIHYLPNLGESKQLSTLRTCFIILATGQGGWENPGDSWRMAHVLGSHGVPNRVDLWSENHHHDWPTWREMLPVYLDDLT